VSDRELTQRTAAGRLFFCGVYGGDRHGAEKGHVRSEMKPAFQIPAREREAVRNQKSRISDARCSAIRLLEDSKRKRPLTDNFIKAYIYAIV